MSEARAPAISAARDGSARGVGGAGPTIALLAASFNNMVTEQLVEGTRAGLRAEGVAGDRISVLRVPGAWDLPQAAQRVWRSGRFDAIIAIGCVIRGETAHFDHVAGNASEGLGQVALAADIPIVFGVLTTDTAEQALTRADPRDGNRGGEFAEAALAMIALYDDLKSGDQDQCQPRD